MPEIAISIIVPIYNREDYLADCLASIECQTLSNIEVLCIDDASTDRSVQIVRQFAMNDNRFRLLQLNENQGAATARNYAFAHAQGDFIAFIDSDDWYPENTTLEMLYTAAQEHQVAIVGGSFSEYNVDTGELRIDFTNADDSFLAHNFTFNEAALIDYRTWQGDYGYTRFLYRKTLLEEHNILFPNYKRQEDPLFFVRAMLAAGSFYAIPNVVYTCRTNHKHKFMSAEAAQEGLRAIYEIIELSIKEDLPMVRQHQYGLIDWYALQAPIYRPWASWKDLGSVIGRQAKESFQLRSSKLSPQGKDK